MAPERILVAVAWPYASGPRHLGHVAGFGVPSDIFARFHRLKGSDVLMVSGTDEHGTPNLIAADNEGLSPQQLVDRYNGLIARDLQQLGLTYDLFTRTTTRNHYRVVQDVFRTLHDKGYLIRKSALGAVSAATGRTLPDRYIEGTCPICSFPEARGDQCDNCGNQLDPADLIEPRSRIDGQPPVFRETEHFFLDLPAFAGPLRDWIRGQHHWRPNVRNFSLKLVEDLRPRPITRDLDWGVPIPLEGWRDRPDKRIYVWFDAVIGYLSASVEWAQLGGDPDAWRRWWEDPTSRHYYFMGKDNIVFHTVIWPSILMGYSAGMDRRLQLPHDVVSSEFLTMEGRKFSTSRGVAIYVNDFLSRYDADALRYYLTIAGPETQDSDFTWSDFVRRNNDELVATWGNLVHRTLTSAFRKYGAVPEPGSLDPRDVELIRQVEAGFESVGGHIASARFRAALAEALRIAALVNQYLTIMQPWKDADAERTGTSLYVALRCIDELKVMFAPFLPHSSQRLHEFLGHDGVLAGRPEFRDVGDDVSEMRHRVLAGDYHTWVGSWSPARLRAGQRLREPRPLFRKLEQDVVAQELHRMETRVPSA